MGLLEKIKDIEAEMARTQKNKATEYHLGLLKAKLAKLRTELMEGGKSGGAKGEGFDVMSKEKTTKRMQKPNETAAMEHR
jgi:ribosome-interacting GTPase 1